MRVKNYYDLARKEAHKYRRKLLQQLKKNSIQDETVLMIVDCLTGLPPGGKELAAKELSAMLANGAGAAELTERMERFRTFLYDYPLNP